MSRTTYTKRITRITIESVRSFEETMDAMYTEINFFNPIHWRQMLVPAIAANDAKIFDDAIAAASGPLGMGYLPLGDHQAHRTLNVFNPSKKILESHAFGIGAPTKGISITKYVPEAALNFPLRVMVQERPDGRANIIYDIPSSQILLRTHEGNPNLLNACALVDEKLEFFVRYISGPLPESKST